MLSFPLAPARAARLLTIASQMARVRTLHGEHDQKTHGNRDGVTVGYRGPHLVFHGTQSEALASIKQFGLSPFKGHGTGADEYARQQGADMGGRPASVYFTESLTSANTYAKYAAEVNDDTEPVILRIEIPRDWWATNVRSEDQGDAFAVKGTIPPEWITGVGTPSKEFFHRIDWRALAQNTRVLYSVVLVNKTLSTLGGAGSGNFGHAGRPGMVGGSLPAPSGILEAIHQADGGFTYHTATGEQPKTGFALSLHKDREKILPAKDVSVVALAEYTVKNIDLLSQSGNYLGGWHNPEDGMAYLDVSTIVQDAAEAERLGRAAKQLAYFDLKNGKSVTIEYPHVKAAGAYRYGIRNTGSHTRSTHRARAEIDWQRTYSDGDRSREEDPRWLGFDPSQPRDENGRWTGGGDTRFDTTKPHYIGGAIPETLRLPIFTTPDPEAARWYKEENERSGREGSLQEIAISVSKPFSLHNEEDIKRMLPLLDEAGVKYTFTPSGQDGPGWWLEVPSVSDFSPYGGSNPLDVAYIPAVREVLARHGYDAIQSLDELNQSEIPATVLIKSPSQLKRVRTLAFDPSQPRDERGQWTAFHGTESGALNSILKDGIRAKFAGKAHPGSVAGNVYVATDLQQAKDYAKSAAENHGSAGSDFAVKPVVLQVEIPEEIWATLRPDSYITNPKDAFQFAGDIKPEWIKAAWMRDQPFSWVEEKPWLKVLGQFHRVFVAFAMVEDLKALGGEGSGNFGHAGRPGEVGGSAPSGASVETLPPGFPVRYKDIVARRAETLAEEMGIPPAIINVVDKEPTAFKVGDLEFREAGHFNPRTGVIEINARNSYDERMAVTNGIVTHEISHAIFDAAREAQLAEHKEIDNLPPEEHKRLFRVSGYVRPEMQEEVHKRWPVSAMFYRHVGDTYMETENDQQPGQSRYVQKMNVLQKDDGISDYSKAYWQSDIVNQPNGFERAINETLAEMTRLRVTPLSVRAGDSAKMSWRLFADDLREIANLNKVKARIGRKPNA